MKSRMVLLATVFIGVGALSLSVAAAGEGANGDGKATPPSAAARAITDAAQEPMVDASERVRHLMIAHQDVAGALRWDAATNTLIINVVGDAAQKASPAGAFADDVKGAQLDVNAKFRSVKFSTKQLCEVVDRLTKTRGEWAPGLKGWIYTAPDEENGRVVVGVDQSDVSLWRQAAAKLADAAPVVIQLESPTGPGVILESRVDDYAPWTGGLNVDGSYYSGPTPAAIACTGGFMWNRWGGLGSAASTAQHCVSSLGNVWKPFYNLGSLVGNPVFTSPASDTALLQAAGQSYSPTVFVGSSTSNDSRSVVTAGSGDTLGEFVALSGRISGGPVSTVLATGIDLGNTTGTLMKDYVSAPGDSGGPWLQTLSGSGDVRAKGQHIGRVWYGGAYRSAYVPVIRISSLVSASIMTTP